MALDGKDFLFKSILMYCALIIIMPAAVTMQGNEKQECCEAAVLENVTGKAHKSREPTF